MKAIILAAGRGSRMGVLTENLPKCFTQYKNKPLLDYQLEVLKESGITEISVVQGYKKEAFDLIPSLTRFTNEIWFETNMVVSLTCASSFLESSDCIISYADIIYNSETISSLIQSEGDIVISYNLDWLKVWKLRFEDPLSDAETFKVMDNGILVEIGGKAKTIEEIKGQYMGLLKITPTGWKKIKNYIGELPKEKLNRMDMTSLLQGLILAGIRINTVPIVGGWYEIDSENDLKILNENSRILEKKI